MKLGYCWNNQDAETPYRLEVDSEIVRLIIDELKDIATVQVSEGKISEALRTLKDWEKLNNLTEEG